MTARARAALALLVVLGACAKSPGPLAVALDPGDAGVPAFVRVTGLTPAEAGALQSAPPAPDAWTRLLAVRVAGAAPDAPAVLGDYRVAGSEIRFTPRFPFDAGRQYRVTVDPAALPRPRAGALVSATVALPQVDRTPTTVVTRVLPSASRLPENLLRMYVEFSAPMSRASGVDFVSLVDASGAKVASPFLPLDVDFWNPEHTRYTVFFDPGRVKRGILPNEQMGRPLHAGRSYTVVVDAAWRDANGQPLAAPYRQTFSVGAADETPIAIDQWRYTIPSAGERDPLIVLFPEPLDAGLLLRSLGVSRRDGVPVTGAVRVDPGETRWNFTPDEPWQPGRYNLVVLSILEDLAGNRIGRLFEVDMFDKVDDAAGPREQSTVPFEVK